MQKSPPTLGTIQSIADKNLKLKTDTGTDLTVQLAPEVKILQVEPGSKTLKDAVKIELAALAVGDRILVRGETIGQPNVMLATTIVAMKKEDIAKKQAREREEWQRRGIGGLVKSVDPAVETIVVSTLSATGAKDILIHAPVGTILRRYAPGSVSFGEAKVAPLTDIKPGDQLRARGSRNTDGTEFTANEIVSGTFRNISGTIASVDAAKSTLMVSDLAAKKNVEISVTAQSQLRKLPVPIAQRIAVRLKGTPAESGAVLVVRLQPHRQMPRREVISGKTERVGPRGPPRGELATCSRCLARLPGSALGDFQKGDAVMIVATSGTSGTFAVITLLGGVVTQLKKLGYAVQLTPITLLQDGA